MFQTSHLTLPNSNTHGGLLECELPTFEISTSFQHKPTDSTNVFSLHICPLILAYPCNLNSIGLTLSAHYSQQVKRKNDQDKT